MVFDGEMAMTSDSNIALCIPAFNAADILPRLLQSAQAQTIPFAEILVYDDASIDNTRAIALAMGAQVIRGEKNRGCAHGKNILAQTTTCDWIHFHNTDGALKRNFVESALPWTRLTHHRDVVFFSYESFDNATGDSLGRRGFDANALRDDPLGYVLAEEIGHFCGLYRRHPFLTAGGWDEDPQVLQSEDQAGHLRLALAGLTFASDPTLTVINYIRAGPMTNRNPSGACRSSFTVMEKALRANLSEAHRQIVARRLWSIAGASAAYLDWANADRAAALAQSIGSSAPREAGLLFRTLALMNAKFALRFRERLIRLLRPSARRRLVRQS